jgi:predicted ATPase/DNA-binding CsgD family transcriptional regulator
MLLRDNVRLLTLSGPGGVGKTRLAIAIAAATDALLADGACFISLAEVRDEALVVHAIAHALGVRSVHGQSPLAHVREVVRHRQQVLVLDNFEHVIAAAPVVTELLAAGPNLRILATSREALRLRGEYQIEVPPLAVPDASSARQLETAAAAPAIQLFTQRAQAARPNFALTSSNVADVVAICTRLDGLPLAIELTAARMKHLSPAALLASASFPLDLLSNGARDLPERLRTMRATVAWSYDLLTPEEQAAFRRMGVFAGGFDLAAAEVICAAIPVAISRTTSAEHSTLTALMALLDKSMLRAFDTKTDESRTRFGMLETIREFALERLAESGEERAVRQAHARYFLALAEEAAPRLHLRDQAYWLERLDEEHANLRAAIAWFEASGDNESALRMVAALGWFWLIRGHLNEGRLRAQSALRRGAAIHSPARARALAIAAILALWQGNFAEAHTLAVAGEELARVLDDATAVSRALLARTFLECLRQNYAVAVATGEETIALAQDQGDTWCVAAGLNGLARVAQHSGDLEQAVTLYTQSLALAEEIGDHHGAAASLRCLGQIAMVRGETTEAATRNAAAAQRYLQIKDLANLPHCLEPLAGALLGCGYPLLAGQLLGAAGGLREQTGVPIDDHDRTAYEQVTAAVRDALGDSGLDAARRAGKTAVLGEIVAAAAETAQTVAQSKRRPRISRADAETGLTRRELDIIGLLAEGKTDREIAEALSISHDTARKHVSNILGKLQVNTRAAAVTVALRRKLLEPGRNGMPR